MPSNVCGGVLWILSTATVAGLLPNARTPDVKGLIANGEKYDHRKYQYVVALKLVQMDWVVYVQYTRTCTGTLISPRIVLSAAHCFAGQTADTEIRVYPGDTSGRFIRVQKFYMHESYDSNNLKNDIALVKLKKPFAYIKSFANIGGHPDDFADNKGLKCLAIGFGQIETMKMPDDDGLATHVTVNYGENACRNWSNAHPNVTGWKDFLCAVPDVHQTCPGDSGGPLICDERQYAITSAAYNFSGGHILVPEICGNIEMQDLYTFLYFHRDWISSAERALMSSSGRPAPSVLCSVLVVCAAFFTMNVIKLSLANGVFQNYDVFRVYTLFIFETVPQGIPKLG